MKEIFVKFKNGFTLAEVLITLVIIGVVAAMTIPTAINNTKDKELKSQFAKAYSTITSALYQTEMTDFFGYVGCYYLVNSATETKVAHNNADCGKFFGAFEKHLSLQKVCKGNALSDGCVPSYESYYSGWPGYSENSVNTVNYAYVLSNGQILICFDRCTYPLFLVDINGMKGPNAYGKDLFSFSINRNDSSNMYISGGMDFYPISRGGLDTNQMIKYTFAGTNK